MQNQEENLEKSSMSPLRLEAFSDAVMAIIITITVLEFKVPEGLELSSLYHLLPLFFAYAISFQTVGAYWNNHHHLLRTTKKISAGIMWANLHLLFWLSFIPFASDWLGDNFAKSLPTALYSFILLMSAISYTILQFQVVKHSEKSENLHKDLDGSIKGVVSLLSYTFSIVLAFYVPIASYILILLVAGIWFLPDRRIEKHL
jgi:uncharacterized membrane protein